MTDEEKAEEYTRNCKYVETDYFVNKIAKVKAIYLDGLAEGKLKWHDLRKDPDDLPKESGDYWIKYDSESEERGGFYDVHHFEPDKPFYKKHWSEIEVMAWCELPKFEEQI